MSGEFDYDDEEEEAPASKRLDVLSDPAADAVVGLQAALQAYVLAPSDDDDQFR